MKRPKIREQVWGRTPWEDMTPEEHLRETQRLYFACTQLRSIVAQAKLGNEASLYWGADGMGGRALAAGDEALAPYTKRDKVRESIYRAFFRTAASLLFTGHRGWYIHEPCGVMIGVGLDGRVPECCYDCAAKAQPSTPMRPIRWSDLAPVKGAIV